MALAPHEADSPSPESPLGMGMLGLANLLGAGFVRVDAEGLAWPMNEAGATLLELMGGSYGATLPESLAEALAEAATAAQVRETVASTPESRHIAVAALQTAEGGVIALRDHTEERLLQERLLQSEKMASVGQLVSGVAHELNNPLTGVMGFAQLLLTRELDDTVRAQVQTIYGEAERAAKIVQNLLSFARRRRPTKEMADVNALLQRVLELRSYDFAVRNISLDMTLDARMARVWVDPDQIQQVLFNVIKNAEQAMIDAHGGGTLTVVTKGSEDSVRVSIIDDGPGIPSEIQRRIFDPFFTTKDTGQGTGLGLTICYSIIDEHGGRIWVENAPATAERPSGGAMFQIELPVGKGEEKEPSTDDGPGALEPANAAISGRRVLVVDDEVSIRLLLHDILRLDQHSVALASSGIEAADLVEREHFDIIITDLKMPGMDGASFYRQVRQRDPAQARRIIFITGDTVSPDTRAFLQRVTNPVLSKPFKIGPLRDAIESVLTQ
ncbi:MAG TPA: ATP-binding protein [Dehalococcoidia bacterium]|nr:ATP-binding protein [Dehalococcoidia bacterium]